MESERRRLLLADDSLTIQKVVSLTFADEGMDVVAVGSGDEAMEALEESGPPDIALLDVTMPGLSGYEVCERMKMDARWRHVPVILLAGAFEPFDELEARRVGANEVLSKPFQSIKDLIGKVGSLIGGKSEETPREEATRNAEELSESSREARREEGEAQASASDELEAAEGLPAETPVFADVSADDNLIEATPAESFNAASDDASAAPQYKDDAHRYDDSQTYAPQPAQQESFVEARASQPAYAAHATASAVADDSLLDLEVFDAQLDPPQIDDDFVLDVDLDAPPATQSASSAVASYDSAAEEGRSPQYLDEASAFAEAAHGETVETMSDAQTDFSDAQTDSDDAQAEINSLTDFAFVQGDAEEGANAPRVFIEPQVVALEEPVEPGVDLSVEGDVARPPVEDERDWEEYSAEQAKMEEPVTSFASGAATEAAQERGIDPQQLSPETIEAIARRAVELMSERAVQEIAWEVVPALAERLIRQRLEEQK